MLISGTGRTLDNLIRAIAAGGLPARIRIVISSVAGVRGLAIAEKSGIPAAVIRRGDFDSLGAFSDAVYDVLAPYEIDLIVMAGYLRKLLVRPEWEGRMLNIHPALLPEASTYAAGRGMYGERVHAAVLANGDTVTGCTVHLVTNDYDEGPPLARASVSIEPGDTAVTLGARVFEVETRLYPDAIRDYMRDNPHLRRKR